MVDRHKVELGMSLKNKIVRFNSERNGGPVHRVISVAHDGMLELHDMGGLFAPHLFTVADDIAAIPLPEVKPDPRAEALAKATNLLRACLQDYGHPYFTDRHGMADRIRSVLDALAAAKGAG